MRSQADSEETGPSLATRTDQVERSSIRRMFDLAQRYGDENLVHLEIGEPDFDTPEHIVEAAATAATEGATHYTSNAGLPELREAIGENFAGTAYRPDDEIIVTAGAMEALALTFLAVVDPGDEVLVPTPAWPNYRTQTAMTGGEFVEVPLSKEDGFALAADDVVDRMTDDTAIVVLTSPSNPTGQVYDATAVERVASAAADHDAVVVADEVYADLTYGTRATSVAEASDRLNHIVTVGSCSKTYAMTGWRVGWLAAPARVVDAALKFHESTVACAPAISQHAAIAALTGDQAPIREMRKAFARRRDFVVDRVAGIPGVSCPHPDGAFYAFLDISSADMDSTAVAEQLLEDYGVVTAPGTGFGSHVDDHIRISFANTRDRLALGFDRIEQFFREVNDD